jgi:hypothetical protein
LGQVEEIIRMFARSGCQAVLRLDGMRAASVAMLFGSIGLAD